MIDVAERTLRGIGLLSALQPASLRLIETACTWRRVGAGQRLIDHNDTSDDVFFIVSGSLRIIIYAPNGRAVLFRAMKPGDVIGQLSALDGKPRSASAEATSSALVAQMSGRAFRALVEREPALARALLSQSIAYVRELSSRIYEFSSLAVIERVHAELLRLAQEAGVDGNTVVITPAPRHADIANRIATHREAVSRELSRLGRMGLIERQGKSLVVCDLQMLIRIAGGSIATAL